MNELEYRIGKALHYRNLLAGCGTDTQWKWCVFVGLWETSGWKDENDNPERGTQYELLKLVIPGQRGHKE